MKKSVLGFVLIVFLILVMSQIKESGYQEAKKLAENGDYIAFYTKIQEGLTQKDAKELLVEAFLEAVQENDKEAMVFYLSKDASLINAATSDGYRAIDVAITNKKINLNTLKFLLTHNPELDYTISYIHDFTPIQVIASSTSEPHKSLKALKMLIESGADVNKRETTGDARLPALHLSFILDNIEMFETLIDSGASLDHSKEEISGFLYIIHGTYLVELKDNQIDFSDMNNNAIGRKFKEYLSTDSYQTVHNMNMKYLKLLSDKNKLNECDTLETNNLAKYYAATNATEALKLLKNHVTDKNKLIIIAQKNNNIAIVHILRNED